MLLCVRCRNRDKTRGDRGAAGCINLLFSLVVEPGFNHVAGEHIAAQQERVITFERVKRLVERSGRRFHLLRLGGRQVIKIFVDRAARVDTVVDAVKAGFSKGNRSALRTGLCRVTVLLMHLATIVKPKLGELAMGASRY